MVANEAYDKAVTLVSALWPFAGAPGAMVYGRGYDALHGEVHDYLAWLETLPQPGEPPVTSDRPAAPDG